jgi:hypothetical protein
MPKCTTDRACFYSSVRGHPHFRFTKLTIAGIASSNQDPHHTHIVTKFPRAGSTSVLVVEDSFVGSFLRTALTQKGYEVVCAKAAEAIAILRDPKRSVGLLITNAPACFEGFPEVPMLYIAALPEAERMTPFHNCRALRKPFYPAQLFASIQELLR